MIAKYPHSTQNFTEGLFYLNGRLYEGTGQLGQSGVFVTEVASGKVLQHVSIPDIYFGEGIVNWGSKLYEWTWVSHICFVYDLASLRQLRTLHYEGEGWGMTHTDAEIVTSDGSSTLSFRDPQTFEVTRRIAVTDEGKPVQQLNELEYIKGLLYANVWHSDRIARISPRDGHVVDWIDLSGLLPESEKVNNESVLNGIAYDARGGRLFVTGKQWPWIFQIKIR